MSRVRYHGSFIHSFDRSFILSFVQELKTPLQEIYSEAAPAQPRIQISLKQPSKRTFIIFMQEADFQGESIPPGGGTNNGECLLCCFVLLTASASVSC